MNNTNEIRRLTALFFEGATTLQEEQQLYRYYGGHDVAPDLQQYAGMFSDMAAIALPQQHEERQQPAMTVIHRARRLISIAAACAAVAIIVAGVVDVWGQNECVAYIYGKRCTDKQIVVREMHEALGVVIGSKPAPAVDEQLGNMFND
jgi:hypothetical protein